MYASGRILGWLRALAGRVLPVAVICGFCAAGAAAQMPWRTSQPWTITLSGGWPYQAQGPGADWDLGLALERDLNRWISLSPRVTWYRLQEPDADTAACIASPSLPCPNLGPDAWTFEGDFLVNLRFGQHWIVPYAGAGFGLADFSTVAAFRRYYALGDFLAGADVPVGTRWALRPEIKLANHGLSSLSLGLSYSF